jgi:hypothetical protein
MNSLDRCCAYLQLLGEIVGLDGHVLLREDRPGCGLLLVSASPGSEILSASVNSRS